MLLLSGVPATGKSTFGRWLEQRHGFTHVDLEADGLARFGLANAWAEVLGSPPTDVEPLVGALRGVGRPVILSWGFPLRCFPLVRRLHDAGVTAWWFDGDRAAARAHFIRRGTGSLDDWDRQMAQIEQHWPVLSAFYAERTIASDGTFMAWADVFARIVGHRRC